MKQHSVMLESCAVEQSTATLDKHVKRFLETSTSPRLQKAIPPADSVEGEPWPQRGAPEETSAGPLFGPLVASGAIVDGAAANPAITRLFARHVQAQVASGSGAHVTFGKRAAPGGQRQSKSQSQPSSASQSQSASDDQENEHSGTQDPPHRELARFAQEFERQLRKHLGVSAPDSQTQLDDDLDSLVTVTKTTRGERWTARR